MINRLKVKEFHFVLNEELMQQLKNISRMLKFNLSSTIIFILENMDVMINKIHLMHSENNMNKEVNWNRHIHVYFSNDERKIYHMLKSIHKDNNTYSIAGILRHLLKVFIRSVKLYGLEKFLQILEKASEKWRKICRNKREWYKKKVVRQLDKKLSFSVHYDTNYTPFLIKLLN
jgi:hypothetical protein